MPYVDESLLDFNVKAESGIARLWEDHSIHLSMRNLKVGEPGLLTMQKEQATLERYQEANRHAIKVAGNARTIKQTELIQKIILLLQGIPSQQIFELEQTVFTFSLNPNLLVVDLCCNKASLEDLCREFLEAGCLFLHLREFNEFMSSHKATGAGQIVEAFALAIQDFLIFYQHQVNELAKKARLRKQEESALLFGQKAADAHSLTLMEL